MRTNRAEIARSCHQYRVLGLTRLPSSGSATASEARRSHAHLSRHLHSLSQWEREASRGALRARFLISGFTLVELVVVLLIITIILSIVGINLTRDQGDVVRDEAERLALVLQNAQQQAILEGRPYAFAPADDGYRFLRLNEKGRLVPIAADELLAPHQLPPAISLAPVRSKEASMDDNPKKVKNSDLIVFDPSGEFPTFTLTLALGDIFWYVRGQSDGRILSSPLADATAS